MQHLWPSCPRWRRRLGLIVLTCGLVAGRSLCAESAAAQGAASSTATGISNQFNPAISVNALLLAQTAREDASSERNGISLQEAEAQLAAIVDPFWRAAVTVAFHPAHAEAHTDEHAEEEDAEAAEHAVAEGFVVEIEEAYVDGRSLPAGLGLRLGRFYVPFGKHQPLHTHQFPFVEAPIPLQAVLGDHPLIENGATLTATVPLPWYGEASAYAVDGGSARFDAENRDLVFGGRLRQLWDLGDETTVELGGSYLHGPDGEHPGEGRAFDLYGVDLALKWISLARTKGPALTLQGELLLPRAEERSGDPTGWWALAQCRWHRNWWVGGGYGVFDPDAPPEEAAADELAAKLSAGRGGGARAFPWHEHAHFHGEVRELKANLVFAPSEFSAVRAEVAWLDNVAADTDELRLLLQCNFTIGSHPAHHY